MIEVLRAFPPELMREPSFPNLRAIRDCDRREHVDAQVAGGIPREEAERHADEEETIILPPLDASEVRSDSVAPERLGKPPLDTIW